MEITSPVHDARPLSHPFSTSHPIRSLWLPKLQELHCPPKAGLLGVAFLASPNLVPFQPLPQRNPFLSCTHLLRLALALGTPSVWILSLCTFCSLCLE